VAFIGWYLLIAAFVFTRFLGWFFNVGIVTDKRIVDIDFFGLLYKEITSADLNKIQDVSQQQVGAIRALFDFGDIFVQTASETAKIEFEAVPHPARVIDLIDNLT
jgi:membrane protein YdbS with pleckstrin-like domain